MIEIWNKSITIQSTSMTYHQKHGIPGNENIAVIIIQFKTILCYFLKRNMQEHAWDQGCIWCEN